MSPKRLLAILAILLVVASLVGVGGAYPLLAVAVLLTAIAEAL